MFGKVLVANRGEIAVRVIRACRDLGVTAVAVYSEADRGALHVRLADEACLLGPAPSADSYLNIERVLDAALASGAEAVHPGYGFLSENAVFAREVESRGLVFVGPSPESIALMGSKLASREAVAAAGVPVIPGSSGPVESASHARRVARDLGLPVMIKASAGGGGKGMRGVETLEEIESAFLRTRAEAQAAFGDAAVYVEKLVGRPRHIEIQILADGRGQAVHLGERECSIQRRHQKLIEETPSPALDPALRESMTEAALRVARAAGYRNAGTVEFLLDGETGQFYFLEMNTRIQVEHAITEAVTGIDLVVEQLRIAAGGDLELDQDEIRPRGAAIECRIYAENPEEGFLPSPGRIQRIESPSGPGIREDTGVYAGWQVPLEYDALLSRLIAWGPMREIAIRRMRRALGEYRIDGIRTVLGFHREVLAHPDFDRGEYDTGFVDRWVQARPSSAPSPEEERLAVLAAALFAARFRSPGSTRSDADSGRWKLEGRHQQLRGG